MPAFLVTLAASACGAAGPSASVGAPTGDPVTIAEAPSAPDDSDEPVAEGRVDIDVLDREGASYGPPDAPPGLDRCHRRGSNEIGWVLLEVRYGSADPPAKVVESEGLSRRMLDCVVSAFAESPGSPEEHSFMVLLYARFT